jgi:hypothetical protein
VEGLILLHLLNGVYGYRRHPKLLKYHHVQDNGSTPRSRAVMA